MASDLTPEQEQRYIEQHGAETLHRVRFNKKWADRWLGLYNKLFVSNDRSRTRRGELRVSVARMRYEDAAKRYNESLPRWKLLDTWRNARKCRGIGKIQHQTNHKNHDLPTMPKRRNQEHRHAGDAVLDMPPRRWSLQRIRRMGSAAGPEYAHDELPVLERA